MTPASSARRAFTLTELLVVVAIVGILAGIMIPVIGNVRASALRTQCFANLRAIAGGFSLFLADNRNRYPGNGTGSTAPNGTNGGSLRWDYRVARYMDLPGAITSFDPGNGSPVVVRDFAHNQSVFHCPCSPAHFYSRNGGENWSLGGYGSNKSIIPVDAASYNTWGIYASEIRQPARTVLLADRYAGGGGRPQDETALSGITLNSGGHYPGQLIGPSANHRADGNPAAGAGECSFLFADGHVEAIPLESLTPWPGTPGGSTRITFAP